MITTVLFDLDGTLLPMDQDVYVKSYFGDLAKNVCVRLRAHIPLAALCKKLGV